MAITAHILGESEYEAWDDFVAAQSQVNSLGNIHQISKWGLFQQRAKSEDWKWWIVAVFDGKKLIGGGLVLKRLISFGKSWFYVPKGPIFDYATIDVVQVWVKALDALAKQEKAVFVRVEPGLVMVGPEGFGLKTRFDWKRLGFSKAHAHYQPENTVIVDLAVSEEQILAQMKSKGRYNIKLAEKKGVQVVIAGENDLTLEEGVKEFCALLSQTTDRDGFSGHPEQYYLEMLKEVGPEAAGTMMTARREPPKIKLYLARYENTIIAGVIVTFFGDLAIYYFGASSNQHRNVMAPYLLQWRAMQEAKRRGICWYDFLGTAPLEKAENGEFTYDSKHSWAGVTEFKLKFGGEKVDFYPGVEKIYNRLFYSAMVLKKKLRR